jgi:hypothetical protein
MTLRVDVSFAPLRSAAKETVGAAVSVASLMTTNVVAEPTRPSASVAVATIVMRPSRPAVISARPCASSWMGRPSTVSVREVMFARLVAVG